MPKKNADSLPPALDDRIIPFRGYSGCPSECRYRLYRSRAGFPVIVLTEIEGNPGTSITNVAERLYYLVWQEIGRPWPCAFIEHYPGRKEPYLGAPAAEQLAEVTFGPAGENGPQIVKRWGRWAAPCFRMVHWRSLSLFCFCSFLDNTAIRLAPANTESEQPHPR